MTKLKGTMAEISISACRTALQWAWCRRQAGIPLKVQGRQVVIDRPVEARGKNWVCGESPLFTRRTMAALESGEIEEVILAGSVADFGAAMTQPRQIERPTDSTSSPNTEA